jgi:galactokinase
MNKTLLKEKYQENFKDTGLKEGIFKAPKTLSLIGDHTEYNNGYLITTALDREIIAYFQLRDDNKIKLVSLDHDESFETDIKELDAKKTWNINIINSVIGLYNEDYNLQGFNMIFKGDGVYKDEFGYDTALNLLTFMGSNYLNELNLTSEQILSLAQDAQHNINETILPYTSQNSKKNNLLLIDSENYENEIIPFNDEKYQFLITDIKKDSVTFKAEYIGAKEKFENIINFFNEKVEEKVETLRDINLNELFSYEKNFNQDEYGKAVHVLTENRRVLDFGSSIERDNYQKAGSLMYASYLSLKNEFGIENEKIDFLVAKTNKLDGVMGTKASYGGFGQYTVSLIKKEKSAQIIENIKQVYSDKYNTKIDFYLTNTADGATQL